MILRLNWSHFVVVAAGVALIVWIIWILQWPLWMELYAWEVLVPRLQERYGFRVGEITVTRNGTSYRAWAIVSVRPDGELARMGVHAGDRPFERHGGGASVMYHALTGAERGEFAAFDVLNAYDPNADLRTIPVNPRGTDMPVLFSSRSEALLAPTGWARLVSREIDKDTGRSELWVEDFARETKTRLYTYDFLIEAVWSTDGAWVALTDWRVDGPWRCVLVNAQDGSAMNMSERLDPHLSCMVFGWVSGSPRIALSVWDDNDYSVPRRSIFFDVSTRTVVSAR